ncbi:hypothetical protein YC2023_043676 [Brassica napus]
MTNAKGSTVMLTFGDIALDIFDYLTFSAGKWPIYTSTRGRGPDQHIHSYHRGILTRIPHNNPSPTGPLCHGGFVHGFPKITHPPQDLSPLKLTWLSGRVGDALIQGTRVRILLKTK